MPRHDRGSSSCCCASWNFLYRSPPQVGACGCTCVLSSASASYTACRQCRIHASEWTDTDCACVVRIVQQYRDAPGIQTNLHSSSLELSFCWLFDGGYESLIESELPHGALLLLIKSCVLALCVCCLLILERGGDSTIESDRSDFPSVLSPLHHAFLWSQP